MKDLKISKNCFIRETANLKTKQRVMSYIRNTSRTSPIKRYHHRYKIAIIPIISSVFLLGGYLVYEGTENTIDKEIILTQSTINDLVVMIDSETF